MTYRLNIELYNTITTFQIFKTLKIVLKHCFNAHLRLLNIHWQVYQLFSSVYANSCVEMMAIPKLCLLDMQMEHANFISFHFCF